MPESRFHCGEYRLTLDRPLVMGIVNVTPDSFSDGGAFLDPSAALDHAHRLIDEGADIVDIGGESSRPGAEPVSTAEELRRVIPVIEALAGVGVPLSIDTVKPEVMRDAIAAGASIVNDIAALRAPGALDVVAASQVGVMVMHMQGTPSTMQRDPRYDDVVAEVHSFLLDRVGACEAVGIARERIAVDPGFGFGKTLAHNLTLLRHLDTFGDIGCAVAIGVSRKSMFQGFSTRAMDQRVPASLAGALVAVQRGARIVRVHDVAATRDVLAVWAAVESA